MRILRLTLMLLLLPAVVLAQSFSDELEAALAHWRAAVWYSHTGNAGVAALEIDAFAAQWQALADKTRGAPPPPYMGDPNWNGFLNDIASRAAAASEALGRDDAAAGRERLKEIGAAFAGLRARNGITGFSDHVARLGEIVDALRSHQDKRGPIDDATRVVIRATTVQAAVMVVQLSASAPKRTYDDPDFQRLLAQNREGLTALMAALTRQDPWPDLYEIAGLISVVSANYNLLFLRYG
jgi:hypothetical protein